MANYQINAQINFKLGAANAKPIMDSLEKQFQKRPLNLPVSFKIKGVNVQQINQYNNAFKSLVRTINQLTTSSSKASSSLSGLTGRLRQVGASLNSFGQSSNNLRNLHSGIASINTAYNNVGKSARKSSKEAISFAESVGISTRRLASFGVAATVISTASIAIRRAAIDALEFDRELVRLKQVGNDSERAIFGIEKTISKLGITMGVSSKDMAATAVTLRQAGLSARDTSKALVVLGKTTLSPTFEDLKSTTEGVIAVFNQFGGSVDKLEDQFSAISKVSADYAVESSDLVEAVKRSGGAFKAAGGNLNELLAMFTTIRSTTRESAESIATGMRTILARLQDPTIAAKLHNIGVEVYDLKGQFVGPLEAITRLSNALKKIPQGDIRASNIIKDIGGLRQLSRVIPLVYNPELTQKALQSANNSVGKLSEDAKIAQEELLVQMAKIKESFLDLFRVIATDSTVKNILSGIITSVQLLTNAMRELKPLVPVFLAFTAGSAIKYGLTHFSQVRRGIVAPAKGYSEGGFVDGAAGHDKVPAMLTRGEYVVPADEARQIKQGASPLHVATQHYVEGGRAYSITNGKSIYRNEGYLDFGLYKRDKREKFLNRFSDILFDKHTYNIKPNEKKSISRYIFESGEINSTLRGLPIPKHYIGNETEDEFEQHGKNILKFLSNKKIPTNTIVYRGLPDDIANDVIKSGKYTDQGIISTSLDPDIPKYFGDTHLKIKLPKGSTGSLINKHQHEIILPPSNIDIFDQTKNELGYKILHGKLVKGFANGGLVPKGHQYMGIREYLANVLRTKEGKDIYQKIRGSKYIGAGAEAIAFKSPTGNVFRLVEGEVNRPKHNRMLQPINSFNFNKHTLEELPYAPDLETVFPTKGSFKDQPRIDKNLRKTRRILNAFHEKITKEGHYPNDVSEGNIGLHQGKFIAIDPGTFELKGFARGGRVDILQKYLDKAGISLDARKYVRGVHFTNNRRGPAAASGWFQRGTGLIGVHYKEDIPTLMHEFGHAIDFNIGSQIKYPNYGSDVSTFSNIIAHEFQQQIPADYKQRKYFAGSNPESFAESFKLYSLNRLGIKSPNIITPPSKHFMGDIGELFNQHILPQVKNNPSTIFKSHPEQIKSSIKSFKMQEDPFTSIFPVKGFSKGGTIAASLSFLKRIFRPKGTDTIPAMLSPGEFVVNKKAAESFGYQNLEAINRRTYRMNRLRKKYSIPTDIEEYPNTGDYLLHHQLEHRRNLYKIMGNPFLGKTPGYERKHIIRHKQFLKNIINEAKLIQAGIPVTDYSLTNTRSVLRKKKLESSLPTAAYHSVGGVQYLVHGGVVGKDLNMDILQDYLDKAKINIKASDFVKGIEYDENLPKGGRGKYSFKNKTITLGPNANIGTLLHEFGHSLHRPEEHLSTTSKYIELPGVAKKSVYGNGGLENYKPHEQHREAFANTFATYALNKGLTKKEISENFPHLQERLKEKEVKSLINSMAQQVSKISRGGTEDTNGVAAQIASPPRKPPRKPPAPPAASPEFFPPRATTPSFPTQIEKPEKPFIPFNPFNDPYVSATPKRPELPIIKSNYIPNEQITSGGIVIPSLGTSNKISFLEQQKKDKISSIKERINQRRTKSTYPSKDKNPQYITTLDKEGLPIIGQSKKFDYPLPTGNEQTYTGSIPIVKSAPAPQLPTISTKLMSEEDLRRNLINEHGFKPSQAEAHAKRIIQERNPQNIINTSPSNSPSSPIFNPITYGGGNQPPNYPPRNTNFPPRKPPYKFPNLDVIDHPEGYVSPFDYAQGEKILGYAQSEAKTAKSRKTIAAARNADTKRFSAMQKEYGNVTFDIKNLDQATQSRFFPSFQKWLKGTAGGVKKIDQGIKRFMSGLSKEQWSNMSEDQKSTHMNNRAMKMQFGLMAAGALAPMATESIFGNARKPGLGGKAGAKTGSILGGVISGAAGGASIGSFGGPWGVAIGALSGAALAATGSLKTFSDEIQQIHLEKFSELMSKVNYDSKTGGFASNGDAQMFSKAIEQILPSADEARNIHGANIGYIGRIKENYEDMGLKGGVLAALGANTTRTGSQEEIIKGMTEEQKNTLSDTAKNLFTQIKEKNPLATYKDIENKIGAGFQNKYGITATTALGLNPENKSAFDNMFNTVSKTAEIQKRFNDLLGSSNREFEITVGQLEKFAQGLQMAGEQYEKRAHYTEMSSAPLEGRLMASPNDINIGALGGPNTMAGQLHEFSKAGGGYDTARQQLFELLQKEGSKTNIASLNTEGVEKEDNRISTSVAGQFTAGGSYNKQIRQHIEGTLGNIKNLPGKIRKNPQSVVDEILQKFQPLKDTGEAANKQLQQTYGQDLQREINLRNRKFGLSQQRADLIRNQGEANEQLGIRQAEMRPDETFIARGRSKVIGGSNRASTIARSRVVSQQEVLQNEILQNRIGSFRAQQEQFGSAGMLPKEISEKYQEEENKLSNLTAKRNTMTGGPKMEDVQGIYDKISSIKQEYSKTHPQAAAAGILSPQVEKQVSSLQNQLTELYKGGSAKNLRELDKQILDSQDKMRGFSTALKNMADNTDILEAAQSNYKTALEKFTNDYESRKKDADVLAFGSRGEKANLMQRENITQQALGLNQEQFSNLPDQIKKIVFERLKETEGMTRTVQNYDKYGRSRGTTDIESSEAIKHFRQPYLKQLQGEQQYDKYGRQRRTIQSNPSQRLYQNAQQANKLVNAATSNRLEAQQELIGLGQQNNTKQTAASEENFQKYLSGISQSIAQQMEATDKFLKGSAELTAALNNFKGEIKIERNGRLEVIINSGGAMQAIKKELDEFHTEIMEQVINKIRSEMKNNPVR